MFENESEAEDNAKIPVLDKGYVRLVDYMGDDLSIVRSARVSHDAAWRAGENEHKDRKLIRFLMRNQHTSPFESVIFTFEVKAPIFIARQWMRHRAQKYNEISARYTKLELSYYLPEHIGQQSGANHQARDIDQPNPSEDLIRHKMDEIMTECMEVYDQLIEAGVPREVARVILPVSTYTRFFATVDLHNLFHFLNLRNSEHAQHEIQQYAIAVKQLISPIVPEAYSAWLYAKQKEE